MEGDDNEDDREDENEPNLIDRKVCYGLGASQIVHFSVALAGFAKSQVLHFHPPLSEGGFSPAAPQLNPPVPPPVVVVVEGAGPNPVKLGLNAEPVDLGAPNGDPDVDVVTVELDAPNRSGPEGGVGIEKTFPEPKPEEGTPGLGVSQMVHFSLADAGFIKSQVPHFHPSACLSGGLIPAAPQLNPPEVVSEAPPEPKARGMVGGFGMENDGAADHPSAPGFGASHTVHFFVADPGFIRSQVPHFQSPAGLGASHTVHFSVAVAGFIKSQVPHFHPLPCFGGELKPAAPQSNPPFVVGAEEMGMEVNVGAEVEGVVILVLGPASLELDGPAQVEERLQTSSVGISSAANPLTSFSALNSPELLPSLIVLLGSEKVSVGSSGMVIERTMAFASLGEVTAVGDTEDAEDAVSSLSALILNRNFDGSLGAEDLRPKKDLPPVVGEITGVDGDEVPLRPEVCN